MELHHSPECRLAAAPHPFQSSREVDCRTFHHPPSRNVCETPRSLKMAPSRLPPPMDSGRTHGTQHRRKTTSSESLEGTLDARRTTVPLPDQLLLVAALLYARGVVGFQWYVPAMCGASPRLLCGAFLSSLHLCLAAVVDPWYRLDRQGATSCPLSPPFSAYIPPPAGNTSPRHLADPSNVSVSTGLTVYDHLAVVTCLARFRSTHTWLLIVRAPIHWYH
ncbi:hypothetical protein BXZ70DRAFT_1009910 [Cristinia sonorae]|uniref:Uncharacterized protein n=1 Tax=Cristinia sonorae TaxID=1940300 RepID=A0A8K0XN02_9AGAR|nr:hypothetical protein BXZ70DRAFT_1009910 [Cristinia sonorae]